MTELLPCPFCGSAPSRLEGGAISCDNVSCGVVAGAPSAGYKRDYDPVAAWNTRVTVAQGERYDLRRLVIEAIQANVRENEFDGCLSGVHKAADRIVVGLCSITEGQPLSLADQRAAVLETAAGIADAIDSGRGNEKYIAKAIRDYAKSGYWVRDVATLQAPAHPSTMPRSPSSDHGDAA